MVGIGSEVKGHVKMEQMEMAAHGGRWTTIWEMERWDGGGRKEGEMIRRKKEGGCLESTFIRPREDPPPRDVDRYPASHMVTAMTSLCISEEDELGGLSVPLCHRLCLHPHVLSIFCHYFVLLDLYLFPSPPSVFLRDLFKGIISHHHEFCSYFVLFPSKSISVSVLCVQRLDQTGGNFWRVIFLLITPGGVSNRWALPTLGWQLKSCR